MDTLSQNLNLENVCRASWEDQRLALKMDHDEGMRTTLDVKTPLPEYDVKAERAKKGRGYETTASIGRYAMKLEEKIDVGPPARHVTFEFGAPFWPFIRLLDVLCQRGA